MNRGISFCIKSPDATLLSKIFNGIDLSVYQWKIYCEQAWDVLGGNLFTNKNYTGNEVKNIINTPSGLIMLLSMYAFDGNPTHNIIDYNNFLNSNCIIALFIVDVYNIDIYCKEQFVLDILKNNANILGGMNIEFITDDNDLRTGFPNSN